MNYDFDVIVIGGGPGGSTAASLLAKKGHSVALFEKDAFPRFKIGESLLPHSMDILKESGVFEKIDSGKYIRKYGASFIDYREEEPVYFEFKNGLDQDHSFAFEVPRDQFDKDLLDHAAHLGVKVLQPVCIDEVISNENEVRVKAAGQIFTSRYLVDASGRQALLGSQFRSRFKNEHFKNNVAVFNHYNDVKREVQNKEGDIIIGILPDNSWSWHIPFKGEVTSVGVVCSPEVYKKNKGQKDMVKELLQCHPQFVDLMEKATPKGEQSVVSNYSYSSRGKIGQRWIMVGDAATFLDPVFSSGVHISLTSAKMASEVILDSMESKINLTDSKQGKRYEEDLRKGVDRFQSLLLLFYKTAFYRDMSKTIKTDLLYKSFTSAISGDMWNDSNCLFRLGILQDGKLPSENYSL